jgi:poly [ADP-ribose] polymerase 1
MIESSKSGRAKCRACKETIAKGVWRYGEEEVSASFDGTYVRWYHLACAVDRRPTGTSRDLPTLQGVMPQTEWGRCGSG